MTASLRGSAVWVASAMRSAFERCGFPRHIITDKEGVFTCEDFENTLRQWGVRQRFGAVGQQGSISVTERAIRTLKHEWLNRVPLIGGMEHLGALLSGFETYYNDWRPHMALGGQRRKRYGWGSHGLRRAAHRRECRHTSRFAAFPRSASRRTGGQMLVSSPVDRHIWPLAPSLQPVAAGRGRMPTSPLSSAAAPTWPPGSRACHWSPPRPWLLWLPGR